MELLAYSLVALSVSLLSFTLLDRLSKGKQKTEGEVEAIDGDASTLKVLLNKLPSPTAYLNVRLNISKDGNKNPYQKLRNFCDRELMKAGYPNNFNADDLINGSLYSCLICVLLAVWYASSTQGNVLLYAYASFIFGLVLPFLFVNIAGTKRQTEIKKQLPYFIDLLTLCVEAGMDFTTAMIRIVNIFDGTPLGDEISLMVTELRMGKSRVEGLHDLSKRVGMMELTLIVNAIVQADNLGTSLAPTLRIQSEDMRKQRSLMAEEMAMKAPVKLLFPLVVFIFPTTFIVLFAPMVLKFI